MWNLHLFPILFLSSSLLVATTNADDPWYTDCPSNTNYTRGSAFQANLDALLSSLPAAAAASSGFADNVTGATPSQQAYGLAQCRGDVNASACLACLDGSARHMAATCPGQKQAMLIYDQCLLRHSNESFFGAADTSVRLWAWNPQNATEPEEFRSRLGALMGNLTARAAFASPRMFAAGETAVTPFVNIFGMAQCTRDLADDDCNRCLVDAVAFIPNCCDGKQGGRSCSIRFEVYPFYNVQGAKEAMSPAAAPVPGGGPINGSDHSVPGNTGTCIDLSVLHRPFYRQYLKEKKNYKEIQNSCSSSSKLSEIHPSPPHPNRRQDPEPNSTRWRPQRRTYFWAL